MLYISHQREKLVVSNYWRMHSNLDVCQNCYNPHKTERDRQLADFSESKIRKNKNKLLMDSNGICKYLMADIVRLTNIYTGWLIKNVPNFLH